MIFVIAYFWQGDYLLAITIGFSLCLTVILATTIGTLLPLIFDRINIDPAVASGPFITTIVDVGSLMVYFALGTLLFRYFG